MNKYSKLYFNTVIKLASEKEVKPITTNGVTGALSGPSPTVNKTIKADPSYAAAENATKKINNIQSELATKIKGLPANAKPSEADLNDRAGYK
jgi:hypothetical protein